MFLSIITPTYNRADTLPRVVEALKSQTDKDFEWLVLDDGSTDETESVVQMFKTEADFDIRYVKKQNEGKCRTLNMAYKLCNGDYTLVFDSDDWCVPEAVAFFRREIERIPARLLPNYSGISALKMYASGELVGERYPADLHDYVDRYNRCVAGDKWDLIRRDIALQFPFPAFDDERYIAVSSMLLRIGQNYRTKFSNEVISIVDYRDDGITRNSLKHRSNSPNGCCYTYDLIYAISDNNKARLRARTNQLRFYLHGGSVGNSRLIDLLAFPAALAAFLVDTLTLWKGVK